MPIERQRAAPASTTELTGFIQEYSFLKEFISKYSGEDTLKIKVEPINDKLLSLDSSTSFYDDDAGNAVSSDHHSWGNRNYFAVSEGKVYGEEVVKPGWKLGYRYQASEPNSPYSEPISPILTIKEALKILSIKPDFIVGVYEEYFKGRLDCQLTIYEPIPNAEPKAKDLQRK
jgi:hypothetical protein